MKVLLVQPPVNFETTYPLGLAYLAGHLRRHGVEVAGADLRTCGRVGLERALVEGRPDMVGVSAYSGNLASVFDICAAARRLAPRATVVLGGPHVTLGVGAQDLAERCDFLVRGDGEAPLLALARGETAAPGVVTPAAAGEDEAGIHVHEPLEELDFPDREVFPVAQYYTEDLKRGRWTAMVASRGCARTCAFCTARRLSRGRHRRRDPEAVAEEMRLLRRHHGVDGVQLEDDNLAGGDRALAEDLWETLARRAGGTRIQLPNGVDPMELDDQLLALMKRAGVESISLGIESLDPGQQRRLRRPVDPAHLERVIAACHREKIRVAGFFIIGLPGEDVRNVLKLFMKIGSLGLDLAHVSALQEDLPGLTIDTTGHPPSTPAGRRTMLLLQRAFYVTYYAHPTRIRATLARGDLSPQFLKKLVTRFAAWVTR